MQLFTINKVKIVKSGSEDRPRWLASALWGTWPQPPNADGRHGSCGTMWQVLQDPNIPRPSGLCGRKLRHLTFVAYWIACKSVLALTAVSGMVSGMVFKNILFIYFPIFSHNRNIWLTWLICDLLGDRLVLVLLCLTVLASLCLGLFVDVRSTEWSLLSRKNFALVASCLSLQMCELALSLTTDQVKSSAKQSLSVTKAATQINTILCLYVHMCRVYVR